MISRFRAIDMLALLAALNGCGGERSRELSTVQAQEEALLAVQNDHWLDVNIFALRGGVRQRIGTVSGLKTDTLPLRLTIVSGGPSVRLIAEPIGLNQRHVTEPITVGAGDFVELRIRNPLNLSNVAVYRP